MTTCEIMVFGLSVNYLQTCVSVARLCSIGFQMQARVRLKALTYTGTARSYQLMYCAEQMMDLAAMLAGFKRCKG